MQDRDLPPTELPIVLVAEDIARVLRVTVVHARRLLASGAIPSRRRGRRRYVRREDLLHHLRPERGPGSRAVAAPPAGPDINPDTSDGRS
jgi:excisionase family DNA binding protein